MVAAPQPEPFVTRELVAIATSLEGLINEPHLLPQKLRELPHWLKVERNRTGKWKKPFSYWHGKRNEYQWNLQTAQRELDEVLKQKPEGKAGFHARGKVCVIDADGVIDPDTFEPVEPKILDVLDYLKTPVYLSSGGRSLHIPFFLEDGFSITDAPSKELNYRVTEGKSGEFLGGNYPSFVAFTGVALPQYADSRIAVVNEEQWKRLRGILWSQELSGRPREPSEPETLANLILEPQTRALRESEPNNEPFGIKWKSNYRTYAKNLMYGVDEPAGNVDTSISGWVFNWIKTYIRGAEEPTWGGAVDLSIRAEGYRLKKQRPGIKQRTNKPEKWHQGNATNAWLELADAGELVVLGKGEKIGKTSAEDQLLQAVKHAQSLNMKPSTAIIFLQIVAQANGRDRVNLANRKLVELTGLSEPTVKRAKKELAQHACLEIHRNKRLYSLRLDEPCNPPVSK